MSDEGYNGWVNYETWCVNLWMSNDEFTNKYWEERAQDALDAARKEEDDEDAASTAVATLRELMENELTEAGEDRLGEALGEATMWRDLMTHALGRVNWHEIAKSWIEGLPEAATSDAN